MPGSELLLPLPCCAWNHPCRCCASYGATARLGAQHKSGVSVWCENWKLSAVVSPQVVPTAAVSDLFHSEPGRGVNGKRLATTASPLPAPLCSVLCPPFHSPTWLSFWPPAVSCPHGKLVIWISPAATWQWHVGSGMLAVASWLQQAGSGELAMVSCPILILCTLGSDMITESLDVKGLLMLPTSFMNNYQMKTNSLTD